MASSHGLGGPPSRWRTQLAGPLSGVETQYVIVDGSEQTYFWYSNYMSILFHFGMMSAMSHVFGSPTWNTPAMEVFPEQGDVDARTGDITEQVVHAAHRSRQAAPAEEHMSPASRAQPAEHQWSPGQHKRPTCRVSGSTFFKQAFDEHEDEYEDDQIAPEVHSPLLSQPSAAHIHESKRNATGRGKRTKKGKGKHGNVEVIVGAEIAKEDVAFADGREQPEGQKSANDFEQQQSNPSTTSLLQQLGIQADEALEALLQRKPLPTAESGEIQRWVDEYESLGLAAYDRSLQLAGGCDVAGPDGDDQDNPEPTSGEVYSAFRSTNEDLIPGSTVHLHSLESRPELNGTLGICLQYDETKDRWQVKLWGSRKILLLKASTLDVVDCPDEPLTTEQAIIEYYGFNAQQFPKARDPGHDSGSCPSSSEPCP